jgi:hypothetical protein
LYRRDLALARDEGIVGIAVHSGPEHVGDDAHIELGDRDRVGERLVAERRDVDVVRRQRGERLAAAADDDRDDRVGLAVMPVLVGLLGKQSAELAGNGAGMSEPDLQWVGRARSRGEANSNRQSNPPGSNRHPRPPAALPLF